jgi:hypothetical protein
VVPILISSFKPGRHHTVGNIRRAEGDNDRKARGRRKELVATMHYRRDGDFESERNRARRIRDQCKQSRRLVMNAIGSRSNLEFGRGRIPAPLETDLCAPAISCSHGVTNFEVDRKWVEKPPLLMLPGTTEGREDV